MELSDSLLRPLAAGSYCDTFNVQFVPVIKQVLPHEYGTAVAQWLRCCATNRKVAGLLQRQREVLWMLSPFVTF